jgi:ketosteroid isomerase-like protein
MDARRAIPMLIALAACGGPPAVTGLSDQDRAALQAIADQDAELVMARAWDSLAAMYEDGAVRLPPNAPPLEGRAAIRQNFDGIPPLDSFTFRMVSLDGDGRLAYMHGSYTMSLALSGATISDTGKILIVLRKQATGAWRRVADAWNSNLAAAQ